LDEITISATTRIAELRDGQVRTYEVTPEEFGMQRAPLNAIAEAMRPRISVVLRRPALPQLSNTTITARGFLLHPDLRTIRCIRGRIASGNGIQGGPLHAKLFGVTS